MSLLIVAHDKPVPQGSVRHFGKGRPAVHANAKRLHPWRDTIASSAVTAMALTPWRERWPGPALVSVDFYFDRPKSHYRTGSFADVLKDTAPEWPCSRAQGDIDKLQRSVLDALVMAGVLLDDSQVVHISAHKRWTCPGELTYCPGAVIEVWAP